MWVKHEIKLNHHRIDNDARHAMVVLYGTQYGAFPDLDSV